MKKRYSKWLTLTLAGASFSAMLFLQNYQAKATSFKTEYKNDDKPVKGGTLKVGYDNDSSFKGVFAPELSNDAATSDVSAFGHPELFNHDKNYNYADGGVANIKFDKDKKTATVTINKGVKWSDGKDMVAKDLEYPYEIIANKESGSARFSEQLANIEGMKEYHEGKADKISGLELKDDKTLVIHFKEMKPAMENVGSGYVWSYPEPYHYLKDVPMKKLAASDQVRKNPLSYGPFTLKKLVQGESIQWVPNKYYYGKKPNLDKITVETVPTSQAAAATKANKFDLLLNVPGQVYDRVKGLKDYEVLGKKSFYYSYLGFRVGHLDKNNGSSVMNKDSVVAESKELRQALAYALNIDQVSKKFGYGLVYRATTLVPDSFGKYHADSKGFPLNLKKANELLDKAGFKKGKDGYRTQPNGKKLKLVLMANKSTENYEATVKNYLQQWKKIGVKVELLNGRLQEFNSMYEKLTDGNYKGFDMWMGAWQPSVEPTAIATETYSANAPYNFSHFATKENTDLINSLTSKEAFDKSYQVAQMHKWQEYMNDQAFVVALQNKYDVTVVSKKVKNVTLDADKQYTLWENLALTK